MQAGIDLARWFADEAVRIDATLRESEEERQSRRLVEFVRSHGGRTTVKQLQRSNSRKWSSSDLAKAALQGLVDIGLARWEEALSGPKGGRPTKICSLIPLPTIDDTDETVSSQTAPYQEPAAPPPDETSPSSDETPTGAEKIQDYSGLVGIGDSRTPIARGAYPSEDPEGGSGVSSGASGVSSPPGESRPGEAPPPAPPVTPSSSAQEDDPNLPEPGQDDAEVF